MSEKSLSEQRKKELFYTSKEASRTLEPAEIEAADRYCAGYVDFLNASKTEREAVSWAVK